MVFVVFAPWRAVANIFGKKFAGLWQML